MSIDEAIVHNFRRKISPGDPRRSFPTRIVVSYKDAKSLPYQLDTGELTYTEMVELLVEIHSRG